VISYIIRRFIQAIIVILLVSVVVFSIMRLLPGDPLLLFLSQSQFQQLTQADLDSLRAQFGLDKSYPQQYFSWMAGLSHGDFGKSIFLHLTVGKLLAQRMPVTLYIGVLSLILSIILGIAGGLTCALRRGGRLDALVTSLANFGVSVPIFWLGILMIYLFGLHLRWLPIQGYTSPFTDFWLSLKKIIMPVICEATIALSVNTRQTRSSMLEVIRQDYIRTAWSKGLPERIIVLKHILKNGLIPVITVIGIQVSMIIGGAVLIETVFNIPGMGRLLVDAVFSQDYPIVQGGCLVIASIVVLVNLCVDISYGWLDPRIRYG
jgi:peptide/nickel transport system permease protein